MKCNFQKEARLNYVLILLLVGLLLSSYSLVPSKNKKESIDYIEYTRTINKAESFVLDSSYFAALTTYEKAFEMVDKPLAGHCFTAMQVSAYLNKKHHFKKFMNEALKSGLEPKDFSKDSLLHSYIREQKLNTFLSKSYRKNSKIYSSQINQKYRDTIDKLIEWDNKWKRIYLDTLSRVDPTNAETYNAKYDSIITLIVENHLIPLIQEHGYPGERIIGSARNGLGSKFNYSQSMGRILLWHYHTVKTLKPCEYNDFFFNEVKKGNMDPREYATILDFQVNKGLDSLCGNVKTYNEHYIVNDTTYFKEFNVRREKIGLEPMDEVIQKYKRGQKVCKQIKEGKYKHIKLFYWCG